MAIKYYRKEIPTTPVYIDGVPFRFEILRTEDPKLIEALDSAILKQIGGVIAITADEYDAEAKKKASGQPSSYGSTPRGRRLELSADRVPVAGRGDEFDPVLATPQLDPNASKVTGRSAPEPIMVPSPSTIQKAMTVVPPLGSPVRKQ